MYEDLKYEDCIELDDLIQEWEKLEPDKRKKKDYIAWRDKMNYLYKTYNVMVKFKCYKPIK